MFLHPKLILEPIWGDLIVWPDYNTLPHVSRVRKRKGTDFLFHLFANDVFRFIQQVRIETRGGF